MSQSVFVKNGLITKSATTPGVNYHVTGENLWVSVCQLWKLSDLIKLATPEANMGQGKTSKKEVKQLTKEELSQIKKVFLEKHAYGFNYLVCRLKKLVLETFLTGLNAIH